MLRLDNVNFTVQDLHLAVKRMESSWGSHFPRPCPRSRGRKVESPGFVLDRQVSKIGSILFDQSVPF